MTTATIFCPANRVTQAKHLLGIIGLGPADLGSFASLNWTDGVTDYGLHTCPLSGTLAQMILMASQGQLNLMRPIWDTREEVNLAGAQGLLAAASYVIAPVDPEDPPTIGNGIIVGIGIGFEALAQLAGLELKESQ